ncbi:MAG: DEAD/DEAH box helicase [Phaeodactylibacter sp.]|nr:DEAD/DEAH box helicase [Phaeodactylibacter sp.]MCB0613210.1 DEAD/DEAH box helicase [Phaeodactylibacter sp.]
MKFSEFGFEPELIEGLDAMGFETATPVQELAIPPIMEERDVLACAQTGTGKTAAFLLPILNRLTKDPNEKGVDTIIIEPTRELAMQVDQQLEALSYFTPVSSIAIYGGRDGQAMEQEKRALKRGAAIIVCTPGRFSAHLDFGYAKLDTVRHLILDEADRMLDMGFAPAIMDIVNRLPRERQTLLFSATMPGQIRKFAKELLRDPVEINIAISKPAENILQLAYEVENFGKIALTERILETNKRLERVLIFAGTKKNVRELAASLNKRGMDVGAIHSDLTQDERVAQLHAFKSGATPIIVATDVLSRGIDIKGIDAVINFDVPGDAEDYVHRIGRTGRADAAGMAFTFISRKDRGRFTRIEELIERRVQRLPLPPDLANVEYSNSGGGRGGRGRSGGGGGKGRGRSGGGDSRGGRKGGKRGGSRGPKKS